MVGLVDNVFIALICLFHLAALYRSVLIFRHTIHIWDFQSHHCFRFSIDRSDEEKGVRVNEAKLCTIYVLAKWFNSL